MTPLPPTPGRERWAIGALCAGVAAARVAWASAVDLAPDEAYYWTWSIDAPGPDHPPGVAWLVRAGTLIAGDTALGVRLGAIACGAAVMALVWAIVREAIAARGGDAGVEVGPAGGNEARADDWSAGPGAARGNGARADQGPAEVGPKGEERVGVLQNPLPFPLPSVQASEITLPHAERLGSGSGSGITPPSFETGAWPLLAAALVGLSPLGATAAVVQTPDGGLSAAWCLALLGLGRAARGSATARGTAGLWIAGAATAAGLLFKLTMGLFPLVALATLASSARGRALLRTPHPWGAALLGALPLAGMALAARAPFAFQLARAAARPGGPIAAAELVGAQVALATPLVALGVAAFLGARAFRFGTLWWSAVLPLAAFACGALVTRPEASWPGVAHAGAVAGAVLWARARRARDRRPGIGWATAAATALALGVTTLAHLQAIRPVVAVAPPLVDPTERLSGWSALGRSWSALRDAHPSLPACAEGYALAAELRFHDRPLRRPVCAGPPPAAAPERLLLASDRPLCPGDVRILSAARAGRAPRSVVVTVCR